MVIARRWEHEPLTSFAPDRTLGILSRALLAAVSQQPPTINAAPQAASTLAKVDVPESDPVAKVSGEPAVAAPVCVVAAPKWIPVSERVPEEGTIALVFTPSEKHISIDEWYQHREDPLGMGGPTIPTELGWADHEFDEVTHWMPLPDCPPSGRNGE